MAVVTVDARIEHVTVYASGARIRRTVTIPAPLPARVRVVGLPLAVIEDTVRVEVGGPAVATTVHTGIDAPSDGPGGGPADGPADGDVAPEMPADERAARRRVALAETEVDRLSTALEVLASARAVEPSPTDEPAPAWAAVVAARQGVVRARAERELALREQLAAAHRELAEARQALAAIDDRAQRTGTARRPKLHEVRRFVEVELQASVASEIVIRLEYLVAAARWAPTYVARLEGEEVGFELRALVAQATGEDWERVSLALSTAEPDRFAVLPELAAQRIGRRQHEPARAGFRAPPVGAAALYTDYEQAFHATRGEPPAGRAFASESRYEDSTYDGLVPVQVAPAATSFGPPPEPVAALAEEVWDEDSSHAKEAFHTPPRSAKRMAARTPFRGAPAPPPSAAPMSRQPSPPVPVTPVPRLDYGNLRMAPPSSPLRGQLIPAPADELATEIAHEATRAEARLAALPLPPGCRAGWSHTYDYAFATDGVVDVRGDGAWHAIPVTAAAGRATLRYVAVPREQADVFRVATITNPLFSPLLPGPIDVYDRGQFLVTSSIDFTPPGASVEVGLGVDAAIKIARNTEFREEASGMLRGALRLVHAIAIDVENLSGRAVDLEIRERIPVTREGDDDVEISVGRVEPAWERWSPEPAVPHAARLRGGYRWKLHVPAGGKRTLRAGYEIKIAGKHELVGGNRREP